MASTVSWAELKHARADLAEAGQEMLYQYGLGLAFLATIRPDGGPRLHPMCPMITQDGLYAFIIPSPKRGDLLRDGRFAMHSFPKETNEDAFYVAGRVTPVTDPALRGKLEEQYRAERPSLDPGTLGLDRQDLFEFQVEIVLVTRTTSHGDPNPRHEVWHPWSRA